MKGTPVVGQRYVGRDNVGEHRGVLSVPDGLGPYRLTNAGGVTCVFTRNELTPLVPRKSPPTPPAGWAYTEISGVPWPAIRRTDSACIVLNAGRPVVYYSPQFTLDELVTVAKFLRRLAKWHARRGEK